MKPKAPKALLVLGTGSHVGKSLVAAGLCRILSNRSQKVMPFKAQNMALNSGVTPDGGEIGRAQMLQARASRCLPTRDMNPVLLKPVRGQGCQVILRGKPYAHMSTRAYYKFWPKAARIARQAYQDLSEGTDWMVLEGAGSPAEVNLARHDLANLEAARFSGAPWILVVDIERGGSFAAITGTLDLVPRWLKSRLRGVIFNKFRGDTSLLDSGLRWLKRTRGIKTLGVIPYFPEHGLEEEDSLGMPTSSHELSPKNSLKIEVIRHKHISNFNDILPLQSLPGIQIRWRVPGESPAWAKPDLVILPGSKDTLSDLWELQRSGESSRLKRLARQGTWILGLCGGFQMLGHWVSDPGGFDSMATRSARKGQGLGLLEVSTVMAKAKTLALSSAPLKLSFGRFTVKGYEIHQGQTLCRDQSQDCFCGKAGKPGEGVLGAGDRQGGVLGTYLHGLLENDEFRTAYLNRLCRVRGLSRKFKQGQGFEQGMEARLDAWAAHLEKHLDLNALFA